MPPVYSCAFFSWFSRVRERAIPFGTADPASTIMAEQCTFGVVALMIIEPGRITVAGVRIALLSKRKVPCVDAVIVARAKILNAGLASTGPS